MRLLLLLCALVPGAVSAQVYFGVKGGNVSAIDIASRKEWNVASLPSSDIEMLASDDAGVLYAVARASAESPQVFTLVQARGKSTWSVHARMRRPSRARRTRRRRCATSCSARQCRREEQSAERTAAPASVRCRRADREKRFGEPSLSTSLQVADELRWLRTPRTSRAFADGSEPLGAPDPTRSAPCSTIATDSASTSCSASTTPSFPRVVRHSVAMQRSCPRAGDPCRFLQRDGRNRWINRTKWNSSESHCIWFGVTCDDDGNVEALSVLFERPGRCTAGVDRRFAIPVSLSRSRTVSAARFRRASDS